MNNFGRCLGYGKGIDNDFLRAGKYYRLASESNDADAQKTFGFVLNEDLGIMRILSLRVKMTHDQRSKVILMKRIIWAPVLNTIEVLSRTLNLL
jgi:TPR repeat protein